MPPGINIKNMSGKVLLCLRSTHTQNYFTQTNYILCSYFIHNMILHLKLTRPPMKCNILVTKIKIQAEGN